MKCVAIILAGGSGTRVQSSKIPKQFLKINNKEIILYTLERFVYNSNIDTIIVPCNNKWKNYLKSIVNEMNWKKIIHICDGGDSRNHSIYKALEYIRDKNICSHDDIIITHDSVRMFVTDRIINDNIDYVKKGFITDTCIKSSDTIVKTIDGENIFSIPNRDNYFLGQTPQCGCFGELIDIYNKTFHSEFFNVSDMCKLAIKLNKDIKIIRGEPSNFKITNDFDIDIAKKILKLYEIKKIKLIEPHKFSIFNEKVEKKDKYVLVKPLYLSICNADKRYFFGEREKHILNNKLPMSLIHEGVGVVLESDSEKYFENDLVSIIPLIFNPDSKFLNYDMKSNFMSSNCDGFLQNYIYIHENQLLKIETSNSDLYLFSIIEFISIASHVIHSINFNEVTSQTKFGIWGDGNLAYVLSLYLSWKFPSNKIIIIGKHKHKLDKFDNNNFEKFLFEKTNNLPLVDIAFEAIGGRAVEEVLDNILSHVNPKSKIYLLGVSEKKILLNTRKILEKGLMICGKSRSTKKDFENAIDFLYNDINRKKILKIIGKTFIVRNINDLHHIFLNSKNYKEKIILKWEFK